jgi:hypothetical protein
MTNNELQRYTHTELENARTKGQVVGWIQGAGALLVLGVVFKLIGWIPTVLVAGAVAYLLYKMFAKK